MIGETRIHDHGISPDEVLEQLNKIITPYTVEFVSAISWFSVWKGRRRGTPNPTSAHLMQSASV